MTSAKYSLKISVIYENKSIACGCQRSAVGCLRIKSLSLSLKNKMHFEMLPLIVWTALWVVNTYSEYKVNIFSKNRDITKCQFLHTNDNADAKVIAIPWVLSENSKAKNTLQVFLLRYFVS